MNTRTKLVKEAIAAVFGPEKAERLYQMQDVIADLDDATFETLLALARRFAKEKRT